MARAPRAQLDGLVRALRDDEDRVEAPIGLTALDGLVQRHREAGLDIEIEVRGDRRPLPPATDQAAYRILQESLTNALRHGSGSADVALAYDDDRLEIRVDNPATPDGASPAGHGLVGMRERASLLGGTVAYDSADGRFRVRAVLPYGGEQ